MVNDKDKLVDNEGKSFVITHNLKGNSIAKWVEQFENNEQFRKFRRVNSVFLTHEILSWHRDDANNITLEKLETMAREYIRLRNPKSIAVAIPHFDKSHFHVHLCVSGIEYRTGKTMRLSRQQLLELKKSFQGFQGDRFPELSKSVVNHGKGEKSLISDKEYQMKLQTGRETDKEKVIAIIESCYKRANSRENFFELLNGSVLKPYERGGKISGVICGKRKFRLKRLGFTEEKIVELDKLLERKKELIQTREKQKEKNISRIR